MDNQYLAYLRTGRNQFIHKTSERFTLSAEQKVILENFVIAFDSVMHKYIEQKELADLAQKVSDMRAAQSTYFASRTQTNLDLSRQKERNLDKEIKEILKRAKRREFTKQELFSD